MRGTGGRVVQYLEMRSGQTPKTSDNAEEANKKMRGCAMISKGERNNKNKDTILCHMECGRKRLFIVTWPVRGVVLICVTKISQNLHFFAR